MKHTITPRQLEVLRALDRIGGTADGWGELWTHVLSIPESNPARVLEMRNFDRTGDALARKGLITVDAEYGVISITEAGVKALRMEAA